MIGTKLLNHIHPTVTDAHRILKLCAKLDCLIALSKSSISLRLTKPNITADKTIQIIDGRHILLESTFASSNRQQMMPNDTNISEAAKELIILLNAPNASGKSVYQKQVGLIVYLAHIGCFVPAQQATIARLESIYSRIYCLDCTHHSISSYLGDLQQMGRLMTCSSSRSLILIDEFGKGTNEHEGRALLSACVEHLLKRGALAPMTIVSTHFRGLLAVLRPYGWIKEQTFEIIKSNDGIRSTFKLINEPNNSRSYVCPCSSILNELIQKPTFESNNEAMHKVSIAYLMLQKFMNENY